MAVTWGCPWHGLVKGGQLELPNGRTIAYPQPPQTWPWDSGDTRLVSRPGHSAPVRTDEELAADAAAGRQWMGAAILAGGEGQLHGRPLERNSWIYCAPSGARWLVDAHRAGTCPAGAEVFDIQLELRRFGVIGGQPDWRNLYISLSPTGMEPTGEFIAPGEPGQNRYDIILHDSNPDGSQAVFMVCKRSDGYPSPYAWWCVQMSEEDGEPGAELRLLYDYATTVGEYSFEPGPDHRLTWLRMTTDGEELEKEVIRDEVGNVVGEISRNRTTLVLREYDEHDPMTPPGLPAVPLGSGVTRAEHITAMYWQDEAWHPVTLRYECRDVVQLSASSSSAEFEIWNGTIDGTYYIDHIPVGFQVDSVYAMRCDSTVELTLSRGDVQVSEQVRLQYQGDKLVGYYRDSGPISTNPPQWSWPGSVRSQLDYGDRQQLNEAAWDDEGVRPPTSLFYRDWVGVPDIWSLNRLLRTQRGPAILDLLCNPDRTPWGWLLTYSASASPSTWPLRLSLWPVWQSSQLHSPNLIQTQRTTGAAELRLRDVLSPAGLTSVSAAWVPAARLYGSYSPLSGDVVTNQTQPVCWV
ncbi:hypothetical protein D9M72_336820 [compost metagenome]